MASLSPATGHDVPGLNKKSVLGPPGSPHGAAVTSRAEEPGTRLPETLARGLLVWVCHSDDCLVFKKLPEKQRGMKGPEEAFPCPPAVTSSPVAPLPN